MIAQAVGFSEYIAASISSVQTKELENGNHQISCGKFDRNRDGKELIARAIHKKENLGELKSLLEKHHNQAVVLDLKGVKLVDRDAARFLSKQADVLTRVHLDHLRGIDVELGPVATPAGFISGFSSCKCT